MATKQGNQIFDFDFSKHLGDFQVPGVDVESIVASQRKNVEALTQANQLAYEGFQAVVKRQAEILQQTIGEVTQATKDITEPGTTHDKAAKQADLAKDAFERTFSNLRELSELLVKANSEAFDLLNKRFTQNLEELRDAFTKAGRK